MKILEDDYFIEYVYKLYEKSEKNTIFIRFYYKLLFELHQNLSKFNLYRK